MSHLKRESMEQQVKGAWDKTKGKMKEAAGDLTGNDSLAAEGEVDQVKGSVRSGIGRAGERLSDAADDMADDIDRDRDDIDRDR
jgi:uncharacterized protein YjbJ (UPF0337 family)